MKIRCKLGLHKYIYIKGNHNKYYECMLCNKRKIKIPLNGYQPIDSKWLGVVKNEL